LTRIPEQEFWRNAYSSRAIESVAVFCKTVLPDDISHRIHYRN
jgi:hypothetical protein